MLPSKQAISVASIVMILAASSGDIATLAGQPGSADIRSAGPQAVASDIWGYGVVRDGTSSYTLPGKDGKNSAGTTNTVTRFGVGKYAVYLPSLEIGALNAGTALTTTLTPDANHLCLIEDFGWHSPDPAEIDVQCYDRSGTPADVPFSATLLDSQTLTGKSAYLWANDATNTSTYIPDPSYQYNSTGATNTIDRITKGEYRVHLPGLATERGNVQVSGRFTAPAGKPAICRVGSWGPSAADLTVIVGCRNLAGAKADAEFDLFFGQGQGLKGPGVGPIAYLDANRPTTASYAPDPLRRFSSAGMASHISRTGIGRYLVTLPGMPTGGSAQVTTYVRGTSHCVLSSIATSGTQRIGVRCFKPNGDRVDSEFGLTYLR